MSLNGSLHESSVYIALSSRPFQGTYHWHILITDSNTACTLYHANGFGDPTSAKTQASKIDPDNSDILIVLMRVANLVDAKYFKDFIRFLDGDQTSLRGQAFECRSSSDCLEWVKDALAALQVLGVITLPDTLARLEAKALQKAREFSPRAKAGHGATVVEYQD